MPLPLVIASNSAAETGGLPAAVPEERTSASLFFNTPEDVNFGCFLPNVIMKLSSDSSVLFRFL